MESLLPSANLSHNCSHQINKNISINQNILILYLPLQKISRIQKLWKKQQQVNKRDKTKGNHLRSEAFRPYIYTVQRQIVDYYKVEILKHIRPPCRSKYWYWVYYHLNNTMFISIFRPNERLRTKI